MLKNENDCLRWQREANSGRPAFVDLAEDLGLENVVEAEGTRSSNSAKDVCT